MRTKYLLVIPILLAVIVAGGLAIPAMAQYDPPSLAPANVRSTNGPNAGEVFVAWDAVDAVQYYRIGWIALEDYDAIVEAGGDWLEGFHLCRCS